MITLEAENSKLLQEINRHQGQTQQAEEQLRLCQADL
jgi:hypothetical protein